MTVTGYEIGDEVGGGPLFVLRRARRLSDGKSVLLKTVRSKEHTGIAVQRMMRERETTGQLNIEGIVPALDLVGTGDATTIVLDDPGGLPLRMILQSSPLDLETVLVIAIELARTLASLHSTGFTHLNIHPTSILVHLETETLQLTGLGFASRAPREMQWDLGPRIFEGTLAYTSPEQTGRTSRLVDYRTDFYSFGVTLYEMLTGRLPFESKDPLELVHAHVAKQPTALNESHPDVPKVISKIVLKLMAKPAEERYQGCNGLMEDLDRCLQDLRTSGEIRSFPLGEHDVPSRFELPQKLYGRESETKKLVQALVDTDQGTTQVVLVSGPPGVGKTSLVQRLRRQVLIRGGYFVSGKWDELERTTPYGGVLESFRDLVRQILAEEAERLDEYRQRVVAALGPNLGALIEVVPEMRAITGEPPPLPDVGPTEARNRLHRSMQQFVRVFSETRPLVVFYDNIQWADPSSLDFIRASAEKKGGKVLWVASHREEGGRAGSPFLETLDETLGEIRETGIPVTTLRLAPLGPVELERLVADALRTSGEAVAPLADLIYRKTAGNPFFAKTLLTSLREEGVLTFTTESGWKWDVSRIVDTEATESAVALTLQKIAQLPEKTGRVVSLAAALGHYFEAKTLAVICGYSAKETEAHLIEACEERILLKYGEGYRFEHDQLQQAAYSLIPEKVRPEVHLNIGQLLQDKVEKKEPARIFEIVDHLNRAIPL
ncbi:MAG: AAA family ATPase, partial [Chloroflexi bacterium]|nr:AAA family ATPase [Chloroflexota bacterium]